MPDNASTKAADYAIGHQFKILRVAAGQRQQAFSTLLGLEKELADIVSNAGEKPTLQSAQYKAMQADAQVAIADTYKLLAKQHGKGLEELATVEWQATDKMINKAVGVELLSGKIPPKILEAVTKAPVVQGHPAADWWNGQSADLRQKFQGQMAQGVLLGETTPQLLKRLRGAGVFAQNDPNAPAGVMKKAKRDAEALILTSAASISNTARMESFKSRPDLIKGVQWLATLDGRTTLICIGLSGKQWRFPDMQPVGHDKAWPGVIAHWRCRSTQISVLYSWEELSGKKLPSLDDKTLQQRVDEILHSQGWSDEKINRSRVNTQASMDGEVAKDLTYEDWAKTKGPTFIEQTIGPGRAALYNSGGMTFSDLTDQNNRPLTVAQLAHSVEHDSPPPETLGVQFHPPPKTAAYDAERKAALEAEQLAAETAKQQQQAVVKALLLQDMKASFLKGEPFTPEAQALWDAMPQDEKNVYTKDWQAAKDAQIAKAKADLAAQLAKVKAKQEAEAAAKKAAEEAAAKAKAEAEAKAAAEAAQLKLDAEAEASIIAKQVKSGGMGGFKLTPSESAYWNKLTPDQHDQLSTKIDAAVKAATPLPKGFDPVKLEKSLAKKYAIAQSTGEPAKLTKNEDLYVKGLNDAGHAALQDSIDAQIALNEKKAAKKPTSKTPKAGAIAPPDQGPSLAGSNTTPTPPARGKMIPGIPNEPVPSPDQLKRVKALGGTTGAELFKAKDGSLYVVKKGSSPGHVREEAAADELYRRMGVRVPAGQIFETPSGPIKVTKYEETAVSLAEALADPKRRAIVKANLQKDLAVDMLLGNWDVAGAGMDNVLVLPDNSVIRIDNGGALRYRAMGTPKTGNDWDSTPTELQTMRRLPNPSGEALQPDGANHAKLFSDASLLDIARRVEQIDRNAIAAMPLDDPLKATLLQRYDELRVVARRTLDQNFDGWKEPYAEKQAALSFEFKYKGLREAIPNQITVSTPNSYTLSIETDGQKGFGRLRTKPGATSTAPKLNGTPIPSDKFFSTIETAVKSYNYHASLGTPAEILLKSPKLTAAFDTAADLAKLAKKGSAEEKKMAKYYIDTLEGMQKTETGKVTTVPIFKQAVIPYATPAAPPPSKATSITAELWNVMQAKYGDEGRKAMQIVANWQENQGYDSWRPDAQVAKYWMATRADKTADYYWAGNKSYKSSFDKVTAFWKQAAAQLGKDGENILEEAFTHWHTMTQDVLTWADMPYNDRELGVVRLVRTEGNDVLKASKVKKGKYGEVDTIMRSGAESHSIFKETYVYGDAGNAFWMAVPHHRVMGTYLTERAPGSARGAFLGDGENEFVTDTSLMPSTYSADNPATVKDSTKAAEWGVPLKHLRP